MTEYIQQKLRGPFDPKLRAILLEYTIALNDPTFPGEDLAAWQAEQNRDRAEHVTRWTEARLQAWRNDTTVNDMASPDDLNAPGSSNPPNTKPQHP